MAGRWTHCLSVGAVLFLFAGSASGRELPRWNLGKHAAAVYDRTHEVTRRPETRRRIWYDALNPAFLLGGELDDERRSIKSPLVDLRDLPMRLAFDLRYAQGNGRRQIDIPRTRTFERAHAVVSYGPVTESGRQRVVALLRPGRPEGDRERRRTATISSGRIVIVRTIDARLGRVAEFRSTFSARIEARPDREPAESVESAFQISEHWTWREEFRAPEYAFQKRVDKAIRAGLDNLRGVLKGVFDREPTLGEAPLGSEARRRWIHPGYLGIVLLALIKCGADPSEPVIARGLDELRRSALRETYEISVAIMTLEALYAPPRERERFIQGLLDRLETRRLPPKDLALVSRWTEQLLENHDTSIDAAYVRRWRYRRGHDYDNSNSQYALLGLYSAKLCGVRIPTHVWIACRQHWLDEKQSVKGPARRLKLTTHAQMRARKAKGKARDGHRTVTAHRTRRKDELAAWGYSRGHLISGSMTAAGISSLTICLAALERSRAAARELRPAVVSAIRGGLAWFVDHYTVRGVPGDPHSLGSRYYYLFGVERACELSQTALFQDRHWYFEGAAFLILQQSPRDGGWRRWEDTAFALLFLKKAVLPVITGVR